MKKNFNLILLFVFIAACKNIEKVKTPEIAPLPLSYNQRADSTNVSDMNWQQFFNDSDLISLLNAAVKNNPDIFIAIEKIHAAEAKAYFAKNMLFPYVNGNVAASQRKFGLYTMDGAGNISTEITPGEMVPVHLPDYYIGLQSSWEIDIWGKLKNKKRAALARYLASVEGKNVVVTDLIARVATAYYELLALDNQLDIVRETIKLEENALRIVKVQKLSAETNELAVQQFEAQLLNSQTLEIEVLQQIVEFENLINFLCGRYPQSVTRNKITFMNSLPEQVKFGIPSDLLKNRPDIKQAQYDLLETKADLKAARAAFYPSFIISGGIGFQAFKPELLFSTPQSLVYSILGTLVAPLINRSAIQAEFKTAGSAQITALYNYQKVILNAYVEVYNELIRIENLEKIYHLKDKEVQLSLKAINTSSALFKTGRANYLEVLMTQKNMLLSRLELVTTRKRQYQSVISIYKDLGGGWK